MVLLLVTTIYLIHPPNHTRGVIWLCGYSGDGQLFIYLIPLARLVPPLALLGVNSKWDIWGGCLTFTCFHVR